MRRLRGAAALTAAAVSAGLTLAGLTGCASAGGPVPTASVGPGGAVPPVSILVDGRAVPYANLQPVSSASIAARSATDLTVFATGSSDHGGGPCGPPAIRILLDESASTVRVLVADYETRAAVGPACPAIGYGATPHAVSLRSPLAGRGLVDAATGKAVDLIDGSTVPDLPAPPAPFTRSTLERRPDGGPIERTWTYQHGHDARSMDLLTAAPTDLDRAVPPYGRIVRRFDVQGAPATLYLQLGDGDPTYEAQWTPNPAQTIRLELIGSPHQHWTQDEAVALARAVTGYRAAPATDRLPPAPTPGTVGATYSSADGPVDDVQGLLKSSSVWIGLACQGAGRVTVTLRGVVHGWTCAPAPRDYLARSRGAAEQPFVLDVHATAGVRWTVTLARASLDGT
jgi:hypothetical protein